MMKNIEQAIREAAYYNWQNAGCPQGQDEYFWAMAVEQFSTKAAAANLLANHHLQRNALLLLPRKLLLASPARAKVQALKNLLNRFVLASKTIKKVPVFKELFYVRNQGFRSVKSTP
ncbi:MAG: DUF2934 domain-containing protein [Alphaproteobacteria bacterium]